MVEVVAPIDDAIVARRTVREDVVG